MEGGRGGGEGKTIYVSREIRRREEGRKNKEVWWEKKGGIMNRDGGGIGRGR
jgi:hypothetical protein